MTRFFPEKPQALAEAAVMDTTLPGAQEAPLCETGPGPRSALATQGGPRRGQVLSLTSITCGQEPKGPWRPAWDGVGGQQGRRRGRSRCCGRTGDPASPPTRPLPPAPHPCPATPRPGTGPGRAGRRLDPRKNAAQGPGPVRTTELLKRRQFYFVLRIQVGSTSWPQTRGRGAPPAGRLAGPASRSRYK